MIHFYKNLKAQTAPRKQKISPTGLTTCPPLALVLVLALGERSVAAVAASFKIVKLATAAVEVAVLDEFVAVAGVAAVPVPVADGLV
jgi:hypothetical protein